MNIRNLFSKKDSDMLDDLSYILDSRHIAGPWHQYDYLLAAQGYGWDYMVGSADYMATVDLDDVGTLSVSPIMGGEDIECINEYKAAGNSVLGVKTLKNEAGLLGIGGISRVLKNPVKIVWINQTRTLRFLTPLDDADLMLRYAETVIRRTFGTKDQMKKGKPIPKNN